MSNVKFGRGGGMDEWSRKINDILEEMRTRNFVDFRISGTWQPATNVYETRDTYFICVELAGVAANSVEVQCVEENRIMIAGNRLQPRPADVSGLLSIHVMEIDEGPFCREIDLPDPVEYETSDASYAEGYLWITLPKKAK